MADHTLIENINAMKAWKGSRRRAPLIMNLGTVWRQRSTAGPVEDSPPQYLLGGLLADPSLMLSKRHKSHASTGNQNVSCPDQRLLFYTNHANPVHIYQKNDWGTSSIKSVTT